MAAAITFCKVLVTYIVMADGTYEGARHNGPSCDGQHILPSYHELKAITVTVMPSSLAM